MPTRRVLCSVLALLSVLLAGCSGAATPGAPTSGTSSSPQLTATGGGGEVIDTSPATETSGPESPQPKQGGTPSIEVASLPVGGGPAPVGDLQCTTVSVVDAAALPAGVVITLQKLTLDPDGLLKIVDPQCDQDGTACDGSWQWTAAKADASCLVAVKQIADPATVQPGTAVTLRVAAEVRCDSAEICDRLRPLLSNGSGGPGSLGGSSIQFTVDGTASETPSPSSSGQG